MHFLVLTFALTAITLALIGWLSIRIGDAIGSLYGRAVLAALVAACFLAGPAVATLWFTALGRAWYHIWFEDLPMLILLSPIVLATLAVYGVTRAGIQHDAWRSAALVTYACSGLFGVLNIVNFCSPGWCGRYGFPFAYYEWSDSVLVLDGVWPDPYHAEAFRSTRQCSSSWSRSSCYSFESHMARRDLPRRSGLRARTLARQPSFLEQRKLG